MNAIALVVGLVAAGGWAGWLLAGRHLHRAVAHHTRKQTRADLRRIRQTQERAAARRGER